MLQPQELVMSKKKHDPNQDQDQEQEQAQAQANLQAQLQGQGQGQLQGQGQGQLQFAVQSLESNNENENANGNLNGNGNLNFNENENEVDNKVDNSLDNKVDNDVDNDVDNNIENTVNNEVNVDVDVKVDLDLSADGLSSPVIDLHGLECISGSIIMPDVVNQTLNGNGNMFNIDQVNNLVDNDYLYNPQVSYSGSGFEMEAKAEGGESRVDADVGNVVGAAAHGVASSADAILTQDAFNQTITQGANIQFNSITIQAAGNDITDDHHLGS
jgi:hypothetical protein